AEKRIVGIDHAEVGGLVAEKWNFPQTIVDGIRWHHNPDKAESNFQMIDIVHVADAICLMQGYGVGRDDVQYKLNNNSVDRLNITMGILEQITSELVMVLDGIDAMFIDNTASVPAGR
ncbi:MAG: HDOD domain-containing protein, partial [Candidatus Zixiibacteriota bacterium]